MTMMKVTAPKRLKLMFEDEEDDDDEHRSDDGDRNKKTNAQRRGVKKNGGGSSSPNHRHQHVARSGAVDTAAVAYVTEAEKEERRRLKQMTKKQSVGDVDPFVLVPDELLVDSDDEDDDNDRGGDDNHCKEDATSPEQQQRERAKRRERRKQLYTSAAEQLEKQARVTKQLAQQVVEGLDLLGDGVVAKREKLRDSDALISPDRIHRLAAKQLHRTLVDIKRDDVALQPVSYAAVDKNRRGVAEIGFYASRDAASVATMLAPDPFQRKADRWAATAMMKQ